MRITRHNEIIVSQVQLANFFCSV